MVKFKGAIQGDTDSFWIFIDIFLFDKKLRICSFLNSFYDYGDISGDGLGLNNKQQSELLYIHYQTLIKLIFEICPKSSELLQESNLDKIIFSIFSKNPSYGGFYKNEKMLKGNFVDIFDIITNLYKFSQKRSDKLLEIANENSGTGITENTQNDVKIIYSELIVSNQESFVNKSQTSENIKKDCDKTEEEKSCNKNILDYEFVTTYWKEHKIEINKEGLIKLTDDVKVDSPGSENKPGVVMKSSSIFKMCFSILNGDTKDELELFAIMNMILLNNIPGAADLIGIMYYIIKRDKDNIKKHFPKILKILIANSKTL
jgi:hypothetical protein